MKKGFTLIELMIVVVVLVTLMAITFSLGGVGDETTRKNITINRMQRLENCLSGYYAAYGSYPPVKLHGSRDYTLSVNGFGLQCTDTDEHETELIWENVQAACRSQPVRMSYPFTHGAEYVNAVSQMRQQVATTPKATDVFEALTDNSTVSGKANLHSWQDVQIFKFGLMSYLLPRFLVMMSGGMSGSSQLFNNQQQWLTNNQLPCRFENGVPYASWTEVREDVLNHKWKIAVLPSQATCARWMPNLENTISTSFGEEIFGVNIRNDRDEGGANGKWEIYDAASNGSGGKGNNGGGQNYALNMMTVVDGWGEEFYYYSLPPHQSYTLWSSGPNKRTFPPWVDLKNVENRHQKTVQGWISDDIMQMSN